jgi:hypothetical protein
MARWLFQADNRRLKTTHLCRYSAFAAFSLWTTLGTLLSNSSNFVQIRTAVQNTTRIQRKTRIVVILRSNLLVWFRQLTVSRMALQLRCGLACHRTNEADCRWRNFTRHLRFSEKNNKPRFSARGSGRLPLEHRIDGRLRALLALRT